MTQQVIALVDDDPHIISLLHDLLTGEGYRTITVTDGVSAPAAIAHEMPDLVILDLWMERQDTGWTIYDALRTDDATARIPVLICSADIAAVHDRAAALDARGDAAMEKPFDIIALLASVERLLAVAEHP
jgi:DNA-binding response OmpR family regulator